MEANQQEQEAAKAKVYEYAAGLIVNEQKKPHEVKYTLMEQGIDESVATAVVDDLEMQIDKAKKDQANKDMLYGALWCVGGTVATMADIGFIFWGAIIFGAVQFFKGVANAYS